MPRLVSLTLLSVLVLPAAGLAYLMVLVIGWEVAGWEAEIAVWLTADILTFGLVIGWWLVLWGRSIQWTPRMTTATWMAVAGSALLGFAGGAAAAFAVGDVTFGLFVGWGVAVVVWLVSACILWRSGGAPSGDMAGLSAADVVICPKCGYALNGLREARCPECGEVYTLDGLFGAQPERTQATDL